MPYPIFSQFRITGLIAALLTSYFLIMDNRAWNPKIANDAWRKTGFNIPYWLADRYSDGLESE